jgi:hypothetical protein
MSEGLEASDGLTHVFARMSGVLFSEESLQTALDLVCSLSLETIPGTAGAGVTLIRGRRKFTAAYSDGGVLRQADELQYELDEGPCLTTCSQGVVARIDCMYEETRWPRWTPAAAALGIASALSVPLSIRDDILGAVKVYSRNTAEYDDRDEAILSMFSQQAAILIRNFSDYSSAQELGCQLKKALETRDVIGMAKGILIAQEKIGEEAAFTMLRQASQHKNIKLRDLARQLVRKATNDIDLHVVRDAAKP